LVNSLVDFIPENCCSPAYALGARFTLYFYMMFVVRI
jgi:hypothetical protein